jgi:hypothetical protein
MPKTKALGLAKRMLEGAAGKIAIDVAAKAIKKVASTYRKPAKKHTGAKISLEGIGTTFKRADLKFAGVDHSGVSYEARIFLNNPQANEATPLTSENGYGGRYHIFGHGGCFGDAGHCEIRGPRRAFDPRPGHPLTPATKTVIATEAVRKVALSSKEITITVVPVVLSGTVLSDYENVVKFDKVSIVTYS